MSREVDLGSLRWGTELVKRGFAKMQKGGVVMDVTTPAQARIAEEAGAVAVMALERVPADIRAEGGVSRMSDPSMIVAIIDEVSIPVMAKCRIGHSAEARVLEALGVDMIDESEVLTPADPYFHVDKSQFTVPFVCGATKLGEAVRRVAEGAAMIRTKGEAGTGDVQEAVRHRRMMARGIQVVQEMEDDDLDSLAGAFVARYEQLNQHVLADMDIAEADLDAAFAGREFVSLATSVRGVLEDIRRDGRLPVVDFTAGGIATPADAALMMQMGSDGVFVGSGIFKSGDPARRARAIVEATTHFEDAARVGEISKQLGEPMVGRSVGELQVRLAERGW
ncbi:MAG: pyridoxal 5-phosphate synthase pdxS subunit [Thermoplasmata archaeon]|jgi:pyridoxal 5'-phosphate synthase pdxS subunit|nr:pyridoxal 5-phosphate synthase pdxS subunit [Thermoplasmata archaeon]